MSGSTMGTDQGDVVFRLIEHWSCLPSLRGAVWTAKRGVWCSERKPYKSMAFRTTSHGSLVNIPVGSILQRKRHSVWGEDLAVVCAVREGLKNGCLIFVGIANLVCPVYDIHRNLRGDERGA